MDAILNLIHTIKQYNDDLCIYNIFTNFDNKVLKEVVVLSPAQSVSTANGDGNNDK